VTEQQNSQWNVFPSAGRADGIEGSIKLPLLALAGLFRNTLVLTVAIGTLAGCAVGPDFTRPALPEVKGYTPTTAKLSLTPGAGEPSQRLVEAQAIPADWWRLFRSPALDEVVREAMSGSPSLNAARATLAQSQQAVAQARGGYYPQVDFAASAERQRGPAFALGLLPSAQGLPVFNLYSLGPTVSYSPDVFGLTARRVEQQEALAETQGYQLAAAHLAITGNVVTQALIIASARRQIDALREIVADDEKNLALVRDKFAAGKITWNDVLAAETQLANDRTLLPPLEQQRSAAEDALAILVGKSPAEWTAPEFDLADFSLPPELPVSLPSTLVQQRPDILAAEAELHASSAAIGVATAQMYPNFPLSASVDTAALATTSLFEQSSLVWTLVGGLTAPIFHGGALEAQKRGAVDAFHASLATYRQTVLQAFGQVADTLRALDHDAQLVDDERHALDAANGALELQRSTYAAGRTDLLRLLDAERSAQQARLGYARAEVQRFLDSAALFVAMGGGWWEDPTLCADCRPRIGALGGSREPATSTQTEGAEE
jgi:NodT family efflux transporter outer membrane factor (OMF) lipoprotein